MPSDLSTAHAHAHSPRDSGYMLAWLYTGMVIERYTYDRELITLHCTLASQYTVHTTH